MDWFLYDTDLRHERVNMSNYVFRGIEMGHWREKCNSILVQYFISIPLVKPWVF